MASHDPEIRHLAAKVAANSRVHGLDAAGRRAMTAPMGTKGTEALLAKFEQQVDPDGALDPSERRKRAVHARRLHMSRLSLKAAQSRVAAAHARRAEAGAA